MVVERLELNRSVRDVLDELAHPQKPPVRWLPALLWRPFAALAAHYALQVTVGVLPPVLRERLGLCWTDRQQRRLRRFARVVRCLTALVPPPLRIAPAMFLAYRNTHRPGTDPHTRRPLGATV
ncbi:oxygenase MpaB family protein [Streptomyces sp. YGL11-2]|uniref:oxygenase MpaB family protein n=1 Tax=Streptomyces sp. YGL11-2 TaxID=3414028 RepID=UPI003CE8F39F